jgi:hypothetical protein
VRDPFGDEEDALPGEPSTVEEEKQLRELQSRIEKLKDPPGGGNKTFARGVSLVTSMGFVVAGCTVSGLYLGRYLAEYFAVPALQLAGLGTGLLAALFAVIKLMKPFLKG